MKVGGRSWSGILEEQRTGNRANVDLQSLSLKLNCGVGE